MSSGEGEVVRCSWDGASLSVCLECETKSGVQETAGPRVWVDKDRAEPFLGWQPEELHDFLLRRVRQPAWT